MKKLFINNLGLKITSIIIAIIMYGVISYDGNSSLTDLKYPVVANFPADIYIDQSLLPTSVMVSYRGPFAQFRLDKEHIQPFSVTFNQVSIGQNTLELTPAMVPQIPGLEVTRVSPSHITVTAEPIIEHDARIEFNKTGALDPNYEITSTVFEPGSVAISGPASTIQNMDYIYNKVFDISGLNHSVTQDVELQDLFYPLHYVNKNLKVSVTLNIEERSTTKILKNVPFVLDSTNPLITINNKARNVVIKGRISLLNSINPSSAYLSVPAESLENLTEGTYNIPTVLRGLPDEIVPQNNLPLARVIVKAEQPQPPTRKVQRKKSK